MLTALKSLLGDAFSGPVKDQRISLSHEQAAILERELVKSQGEIASLSARVSQLEAENADLHAKLAERDPVSDGLDEPTREVLQLLFDAGDGLDIDAIRSPFGFSVSEAKFHIGVLMDLKFIEFQEGLVGFVHTDAFGDSHYSGGSPDVFYIQQKGRAYLMKKG